ncbi:heat shock protein DnaJ, partial [Lophium mytilinum]
MDHYTTLGVAQTATKDAIRTAYKKLALKFHPDKVTDPAHRVASEEAFKAVGNAYEILFDDKKRATYD